MGYVEMCSEMANETGVRQNRFEWRIFVLTVLNLRILSRELRS